jgi:hypothetical protein
MGRAAFTATEGTFEYSALVFGDDVVSQPGTIDATITTFQPRGSILKWAPSTGVVTAPAVETDCNAILVNDWDPVLSGGPACQVYTAGSFKADAITWPGALSHALITDQLRHVGMFIESVLGLAGTVVKSAPTEAEAAAAKAIVDHNRAEAQKKEAAKKEADTKQPPKKDDPAKPEPSDAPSAYLTTEERIMHPEYADPIPPPPPAPAEASPAQLRPEDALKHPVSEPHSEKHPATAPLHNKEPHQK